MKEKVKILISFVVILICLPYLITYFFQGEKTSKETENKTDSEIVGILAAQIPVTVEQETIKAQAVIIRTQLEYEKEHGGNAPDSLSKKEMEELWGQENYYEFYEKMVSAVDATNGQVMKFEGEVINPSYHKVSAGYTRDGSTIYKNAPYLLSVSSEQDILSEDYLTVKFYSLEEMEKKLKGIMEQKQDENGKDTIEAFLKRIEIQRDGADYVTSIKIDGKEVDTEKFVEVLDFPSSCFFLKEMDSQIRVVTKGCGHGFGLSQYGANEMAKNGKNYEEILKYYFSGIKIEKTGKH